MRVGINGRHLGTGKTGVGRYLLSLLRVWGTEAREHEFVVYLSRETLDDEDRAVISNPNIRIRRLPRQAVLPFPLWYNTVLPWSMARDGIEVFFSGDYFCPVWLPHGMRRTLTVHDVSYLTRPQEFPWSYRMYGIVNSRWPSRYADAVFTISQFQRNEVIRTLGIPKNRVHVTSLGVDERFRPASVDESRDPYFLFVGTFFNRRHALESIQAFATVVERTHHRTVRFVLRGRNETRPHQDLEGEVVRVNRRLGREALVLLPYTSDHALIALFQGATAFLYPSTYEGFGLPVLEALACGTPTLTVRAASIPEVAGDAAVYIDPKDPRAFADALELLLADTAWRAVLRNRSLEQAKRFRWENTARETLRVLETVHAQD